MVADLETEATFERFVYGDVLQRADGLLLFQAFTHETGLEPWLSNGTEGGTRLLKELFPGPQNSSPSGFVEFQSEVYFVATSLAHGSELWRTNGSGAGTQLVADLWPGNGDGVRGDLVATADRLFFACTMVDKGTELCSWDGSAIEVFDLRVGPIGSSPRELARVSTDTVCFAASIQGVGIEPWCSDGTAVGTDLLADVVPGASPSLPEGFVPVAGGRVVFAARSDNQGVELIRADLSTGDFVVLDLEPGSGSSDPEDLVAVAGGAYFSAETQATGREVGWYDDLTGTAMLLDLDAGATGSVPGLSSNRSFAADGARLFFRSDSGDLWVSDGSMAGSGPVFDAAVPVGTVNQIFAGSGFIYFEAELQGEGREGLWRQDTSASFPTRDVPELIVDLGGPTFARVVGELPGGALFQGSQPGVSPESLYFAPFGGGSRFDLLSPIVQTTESRPRRLTPIPGGGAAFSASLESTGSEPWSFAPEEGAQLMADLDPGPDSSFPIRFSPRDASTILFTVVSTQIPDEPYLWDGAGVTRVDLLTPGDSDPLTPLALGDGYLVSARDAAGDRVLWSVATNPVAVSELPVTTFLNESVVLGDEALFESEGDLWKSDGTVAGTEEIASSVSFLRAVTVDPGDRALLLVGTVDVWTSDGTVAGTGLTATLPAASADAGNFAWVASGSRVLTVVADANEDYFELAVTDGTPAGTAIVTARELDGAAESSLPTLLGDLPDGWVYSDSRPASGEEPWFTDGVNPPVQLELWPGVSSSGPRAVGRIDDLYYFYAITPQRGEELWQTDGTVAGTQPAMELHPGVASERVSETTVSGGTLYFAASGPGGDGEELWAWTPALFADGFETGDSSSWTASTP